MMKSQKECIVCRKGPEEIPLTEFLYKKSNFYICAQHIPVLIHDPQKLVGLLPDAEKMNGA
jgi:hypothetical protein